MTIACPKCKARLTFPDDKIRPEGIKFKCVKCGAPLFYKKKQKTPEESLLGPRTWQSADEPEQSPPTPEEEPVERLAPHPAFEQPSSGSQPSRADLEAFFPSPPRESLEELLPPPEPEPPRPIAPPKPRVEEQKPVGPPADVELKLATDADEILGIAGKEEPPAEAEPPAVHRASSDTITLGGRELPKKAVIGAGAAAGLVIIAVFGFMFFGSDEQPRVQPPPVASSGGQQSQPAAQPQPQTSAEAPAAAPAAVPPPSGFVPGAVNEEKAIELVKNSEALVKLQTVDSYVSRWTAQNAGKYKVVGWQAKKMEDQNFLVSYTAMDGNQPKGFYFSLDVQTGKVQDLARNPELQAKYNINYGN